LKGDLGGGGSVRDKQAGIETVWKKGGSAGTQQPAVRTAKREQASANQVGKGSASSAGLSGCRKELLNDERTREKGGRLEQEEKIGHVILRGEGGELEVM